LSVEHRAYPNLTNSPSSLVSIVEPLSEITTGRVLCDAPDRRFRRISGVSFDDPWVLAVIATPD